MENNWLTSFLSVIPFAILIFLFLLYIFVRNWRHQINIQHSTIRSSLRRFKSDLGGFRSQITGYSVDDPGEYGILAAKIRAMLVDAELKSADMQVEYLHQAEDIRASGQLKSIGKVFAYPHAVYQILNDGSDLLHKISNYQGLLDDLASQIDSLRGFSWQVASDTQTILTLLTNGDELVEKLIVTNGECSALNKAKAAILQWKDTVMVRTPLVFLSPDRELVCESATKDETILVHKLNLEAMTAAKELVSRVSHWRDLLEHRDEGIKKNVSLLGICNQIIADLGLKTDPAIKFSISNKKVVEVERGLSELTNSVEFRDVDYLEEHVGMVAAWSDELQILSDRLSVLRVNFDAFTQLRNSPEIQSGADFLRNAYNKIAEVEKYHFGNFDPGDQVQNLRTELDRLASLQAKFNRFSQQIEFDENEFDGKYPILQDLLASQRILAPRLDSASRRTTQLKSQAAEAEQALARIEQLMTSLQKILEESDGLRKEAGKGAEKIFQSFVKLHEDFANLRNEILDNKIKRANKIRQDFRDLIYTLAKYIERERRKSVEEIERKLSSLKEIIWLDDPLVGEVEKGIKLVPVFHESPSIELSELEGSYKSMLDFYTLFRNQEIVFERFLQAANPLLRIYSKVEKSRDQVLKLIQQMEEIFPADAEAWPPTTHRIESRQNIFSGLEKDWTKLRQEKQRMETSMETLALLAGRYGEVRADLSQFISLVVDEQGKFRDLEKRLEESKRMWNNVARNFQSQPAIPEGVQNLFASLDREIASLKQQYQTGKINANYTYQRFRSLCRKLDEAVVDVDSRQMIDINGNVQSRL